MAIPKEKRFKPYVDWRERYYFLDKKCKYSSAGHYIDFCLRQRIGFWKFLLFIIKRKAKHVLLVCVSTCLLLKEKTNGYFEQED